MKVIVNGNEKELKADATLKDAIEGEVYVPGSLISVHLSTERLVKETDDFEVVTSSGNYVIHLDKSADADLFKKHLTDIKDCNARWANRDIVSFGSFPTDIPLDKTEKRYLPYDCFFSLGGFDNQTTYIMIARREHTRGYGAGTGRIGKVTVGRHVLANIREGDTIIDIHPVVSETSTENVIVTTDLSTRLEDGYRVETNIRIKLDAESPESAEQVLIIASKGYFNISESTGSFVGCKDDTDVSIPEENRTVRRAGSVTVRNGGVNNGHILIYKEQEQRQMSLPHNDAGSVDRGLALVARAKAGDTVTVVTDPPRVLSVGMSQADGLAFLEKNGVRQIRKGDTSDDAIIVEQIPERTLEALTKGEVETFGVPKNKVHRITLDETDEITAAYFRKVTGLCHKSVGAIKVQFSFPGSPMITFHGDEARAQNLYPQEPFKKCKKGDIGVTNQSRPYHGLIGIRLQDSKEFGPTGEEPYGTNMAGRFLDNVKVLNDYDDEDTVYITEAKE